MLYFYRTKFKNTALSKQCTKTFIIHNMPSTQKIRFFLRNFSTLPLLFLIVIFGCTSSRYEQKITHQADIKRFLSSLPSEEYFALDFFFRCLIQEDSIGYVLLGGKPM